MNTQNKLTPEDQQLVKDLFRVLSEEQSKYKLTYQQVVDYKKLKEKYEKEGFSTEEEVIALQQVASNLETVKSYPISNIRENLKNRIPMLDALTPERLFLIMQNLTEEKVAKIMQPGALRLSAYADTILVEYRNQTTVDSLKSRMRNFLTKSTLDDFKQASPIERIQYLMLCYLLDEAYKMSKNQ
jgi:uncharacterized protein YdiU (UPF0061 family)